MPGGVRERIDLVWDELSPVERHIAQLVLERADDLAASTTTELAHESGTSKASVSRFFRRIGFDSFAQVRASTRALRASGVPAGGLPDGPGGPVAVHVGHDCANLTRTVESLGRVDLDEVVKDVSRARRVLVLGWRNSFPVALHLREQLLQARPDVWLGPAPGQTVAEELSGLGEQDLLVVVAFRRRPPVVRAVLDLAHDIAVPCLLLTDPAAGPALGPVKHRLEIPVDGPGAFDSYASVMTTVAILAEGVLAVHGHSGRARVAEVSQAHSRLVELEP